MLKNIFRYLVVISGICLVFFVASKINNILSYEHPGLDKAGYNVYSTYQEVNSLDKAITNTVVPVNESSNTSLFRSCYYALLIDDTDKTVYASKNAHRRMYPASMTKLMTASVVCDRLEDNTITLDDMVTITHDYDLTYEGIEPCQLTPGCKISVKDLLYGLLIQSNNYYAIILAEYVGGDVPSFCELMNRKAYEIGATNSNFINPHGLDEALHYTTAYDMYLIIKEAYTHDLIKTIDSFDKYSFSYLNANDEPICVDIETTNLFMLDYAQLPANFKVEVWKTGTTSGAGNCLAMYLTRDGHTYIAVASSPESKADLYDSIIKLLCLIG